MDHTKTTTNVKGEKMRLNGDKDGHFEVSAERRGAGRENGNVKAEDYDGKEWEI